MPPTGRDTEGSVAFLMKVAELLHSYGTPAFRLERVLLKVASDLGIEASFLSTPTAVIASVGEAPRRVVHLIRSDSGEVDLGTVALQGDPHGAGGTPGESRRTLEALLTPGAGGDHGAVGGEGIDLRDVGVGIVHDAAGRGQAAGDEQKEERNGRRDGVQRYPWHWWTSGPRAYLSAHGKAIGRVAMPGGTPRMC